MGIESNKAKLQKLYDEWSYLVNEYSGVVGFGNYVEMTEEKRKQYYEELKNKQENKTR